MFMVESLMIPIPSYRYSISTFYQLISVTWPFAIHWRFPCSAFSSSCAFFCFLFLPEFAPIMCRVTRYEFCTETAEFRNTAREEQIVRCPEWTDLRARVQKGEERAKKLLLRHMKGIPSSSRVPRPFLPNCLPALLFPRVGISGSKPHVMGEKGPPAHQINRTSINITNERLS